MLNQEEEDQLTELVRIYSLKGVVDALATIAAKAANDEAHDTHGYAWGHDAIALRRIVPRLWTGGRGTA